MKSPVRDREHRLVDVGQGVHIGVFDSGGTGAPVVILHGLAGSAAEFFATADALAEYRSILVDLRGHGRSTRRPVDLSREAFVDDVIRVIETVAGEPATLVGQSLGAHTALLVAAARPDLVQRLVLLEGGAGGGTVDGHAELRDYFQSWPVPFESQAAAREFLGSGPLATAWVNDLEERSDGWVPRFDPDVMLAAINGVLTPRWTEWETVQVPSLVVYAEHGMFAAADKAEFVRRGNAVQRADLAGASHDAHLDAFQDWVTVLRSFLAAAGNNTEGRLSKR